MKDPINKTCKKCDGKLIYLTTFRINFGITVDGNLFDSETMQSYWVCGGCSMGWWNTQENPEMQEYVRLGKK